MKKNKIPKRLLFFILSIMLMFPIISYAENDFKHMECIDCLEYKDIDNAEDSEIGLEGPLVCPFCDRGEIIRVVKPATCTESGYTKISCTYCDYYSQTYHPRKPHDFENPDNYYCYERVRCKNCRSPLGGPGSKHKSYYIIIRDGKREKYCNDCNKFLGFDK